MEYTDRFNYYNSTILSAFDQTSINNFGLRIGDGLNGKQFCTPNAAGAAVQTILQRTQYVLNTFKFKLGWKYSLLEPMDVILLSGASGDNYLNEQAVRITSIEEDDNGDLMVEGEEVTQGANHPFTPPSGNFAPWHFNEAGSCFNPWFLGRQPTTYTDGSGNTTTSILNTWAHPDFSEDSDVFTLSCWIKPQREGMSSFGPSSGSVSGPDPETGEYSANSDYLAFSSVFATWGAGALYWDGTIAGGEYIAIQEPFPPTKAHPMYCGTNSLLAPLWVGFRGTGELLIQITDYKQGQMPWDPHGWTTVGTGGYGYPWHPWQPYASIRLISDGGERVGFGGWQHLYITFNSFDGVRAWLNGREAGLIIDPRFSYSYFNPFGLPGVNNTLDTDPLGENFFFNVTIYPPKIGWHASVFASFMMNPGLLYYGPGYAGCITDCWFSRKVDLGPNGYNYFKVPGTPYATPYLGQYGELPLTLSGSTVARPDIFFRNTVGSSDIDQFISSWNHASYPTDYPPSQYLVGGFAGYATPDACNNGPWFGSLG